MKWITIIKDLATIQLNRKTFQRLVELVAARASQADAGGSEVDHPRLLDHDGQGVGLQGPRRSMGGPVGS